jgi:hypothetical protein
VEFGSHPEPRQAQPKPNVLRTQLNKAAASQALQCGSPGGPESPQLSLRGCSLVALRRRTDGARLGPRTTAQLGFSGACADRLSHFPTWWAGTWDGWAGCAG